MVIKYDAELNVLVSTKGHPFDNLAFFKMFDGFKDLTWTHIEQPATASLLSPDGCADFGVLLFYDVPGLQFRTPEKPLLLEPSETFKQGFRELLALGKPMVFLHHAIAGWPLWDEYAEAIGARFFYQEGTYKGRPHLDSGYVFPATYRAEPQCKHPVLDGLEDGFELTDELYLFEMLESDVVPLLRARHTFTRDEFYSAATALKGQMWSRDGWEHGPGTDLIAWARAAGASPTVTIQCGNDGATFANDDFRRLLHNAIKWVASDAAKQWAGQKTASAEAQST